ncbi:hypothetical protein BC829DRAFT_385602 [Chytridium lagenaria]|nr:hypothetical protein BC829DRAFT_385602 [Chytridium lagenaria]
MLGRQLLIRLHNPSRFLPFRLLTSAPPPPPTLPRFSNLFKSLSHHTAVLRASPASHLTSFLFLHELTALLPPQSVWNHTPENDVTGVVFNVAASYAIVKVLMPVRVGVSLVLTLGLPRTVVIPTGAAIGRLKSSAMALFGRRPPAPKS